jgi:hypothetical protein
MKRISFVLICFLFILPFLTACAGAPGEVEARLGQEFSLPIGQEAGITGENLRISFEDVIEDSRCPLDVNCIWEGRASIQVQLTYFDTTYSVILNEPGLTDHAEDSFRDYSLSFHLEPYPGEAENISREDYFLRLTVSKQESTSLSAEAQAEIYAAVIRQLYEVDHTFGEPPNFPVVYIVYNTKDSIGDPDAPRSDPQVLPESLRTAITARLTDLPAEYIWVRNSDDVPLNNDGSVQGGGAIVTLGNIHAGENGSVLVSASLYIASLAATGKTYILEEQDERWQVTGDTGVQWIS